MSNAEMPPLACGQVWVFKNCTVTIGELGESTIEWFSTCGATTVIDYSAPRNIKNMLFSTSARLIHGPGAPWSPAEEVPHA